MAQGTESSWAAFVTIMVIGTDDINGPGINNGIGFSGVLCAFSSLLCSGAAW
ncbi:hypothetical protein [Aminivibrio sp.]|uniref:hypothetical protein n=1 Tax=Aminivibrio sp. TaxID=1872489 RepID=UPI00345E6AFC